MRSFQKDTRRGGRLKHAYLYKSNRGGGAGVYWGSTQREMYGSFGELSPEIFPYQDASLGAYTLLPVVEETTPYTAFECTAVVRRAA